MHHRRGECLRQHFEQLAPMAGPWFSLEFLLCLLRYGSLSMNHQNFSIAIENIFIRCARLRGWHADIYHTLMNRDPHTDDSLKSDMRTRTGDDCGRNTQLPGFCLLEAVKTHALSET